MTKGPVFAENKYKTTFFYMSDFLYEFSCLIHCKHFINVFSPIVIITLKNMNFFCFIEKKNNLKCDEIRGTVGSISD